MGLFICFPGELCGYWGDVCVPSAESFHRAQEEGRAALRVHDAADEGAVKAQFDQVRGHGCTGLHDNSSDRRGLGALLVDLQNRFVDYIPDEQGARWRSGP